MSSYRDSLSPRQKAIYDSQESQAASLLQEAQMNAANPNKDFSIQDIQSLKSNFFSTVLGSPHSAALSARYGSQFDALEESQREELKDRSEMARNQMIAAKTQFDMSQKQRELAETREAEAKYDQLASSISNVLSSGAPPHEMSALAYNVLLSEPSFLRTATGQKLLDVTTQGISNVTNDQLSKVGNELMSDAIRNGTVESIDAAADALNISDSPLVAGAKSAAKAKRQQDEAERSQKALQSEIQQLEGIIKNGLQTDSTWENIQTSGRALVDTATKLGLSSNDNFKAFSEWLTMPKPQTKSIGKPLVNPFLDAQNMLNDLFVDVQRNSLIPGARSIKTFDPSRRTRGSYGLGDALIPPRTT